MSDLQLLAIKFKLIPKHPSHVFSRL